MFGISKEKEAEKVIGRVEEKETEDEIQFDFEEDNNLPFDDDEGFAEEDAAEEESAPGGLRALPQRTVILLSLLFLLAVGGGGYYYLNSTPAPPAPTPAPVKTKVTVQAPAPAPVTPPAPVAAAKPTSPVPVAVAPVKNSLPAPAVKVQAASVAKDAPVARTTIPVAAVVTPIAKSEVISPPPLTATRQPFTLSVGAFLNQKQQREIEKKIHRLGYTPQVKTSYSMVPMTRLLLGVYDPAAAQVRRKELATQVSDIFALKQGDKVALYAGSYQNLDQARSFADQLYLRGIHVDEETVSLRMPLKTISYGSFASRTSAKKAAKRAAAAGLSAQVIKR